MPRGVIWCSPDYAVYNCELKAHSNVVWVVKHKTETAETIRKNGTGRISTYVRTPSEWLREVADAPLKRSEPCFNIPAVPAYGLTSTEAGRKAFATGGLIVDSTIKAPAGPRTKLITHVDVVSEIDPIQDTLHYANEAANLASIDGDKFPEDGLISIQWEKVHGRDNQRKFTVTVDFKESN